MGKGDKKSKRGKIWLGSYGVSRNRKAIKARLKRESAPKTEAAATVAAAVEEKPKAKRTPRKKEAAQG